ncbi:MAG: cell division protein ZapA [Candidatus Binatia bacterium]
MKRDIEIEIAGQRLKIRTDEDESYMRELATFVDERMREMGHGARGMTSLNVALLTALRIADEYHKIATVGDGIDGALAMLATKVEAALEPSE